MRQCFKWLCLHTICFYCSNLILCAFQNTDSKSRHSVWSMFFLLGRLSEQQDMWLWNSLQNIRIKMCMKIACPKKTGSNIPVLASVCFMRSVYLTPYSTLQELFIKLMARRCRKCYNLGSFPKTLRQLNVNEGDFILTWNSDIMLRTIAW